MLEQIREPGTTIGLNSSRTLGNGPFDRVDAIPPSRHGRPEFPGQASDPSRTDLVPIHPESQLEGLRFVRTADRLSSSVEVRMTHHPESSLRAVRVQSRQPIRGSLLESRGLQDLPRLVS